MTYWLESLTRDVTLGGENMPDAFRFGDARDDSEELRAEYAGRFPHLVRTVADTVDHTSELTEGVAAAVIVSLTNIRRLGKSEGRNCGLPDEVWRHWDVVLSGCFTLQTTGQRITTADRRFMLQNLVAIRKRFDGGVIHRHPVGQAHRTPQRMANRHRMRFCAGLAEQAVLRIKNCSSVGAKIKRRCLPFVSTVVNIAPFAVWSAATGDPLPLANAGPQAVDIAVDTGRLLHKDTLRQAWYEDYVSTLSGLRGNPVAEEGLPAFHLTIRNRAKWYRSSTDVKHDSRTSWRYFEGILWPLARRARDGDCDASFWLAFFSYVQPWKGAASGMLSEAAQESLRSVNPRWTSLDIVIEELPESMSSQMLAFIRDRLKPVGSSKSTARDRFMAFKSAIESELLHRESPARG